MFPSFYTNNNNFFINVCLFIKLLSCKTTQIYFSAMTWEKQTAFNIVIHFPLHTVGFITHLFLLTLQIDWLFMLAVILFWLAPPRSHHKLTFGWHVSVDLWRMYQKYLQCNVCTFIPNFVPLIITVQVSRETEKKDLIGKCEEVFEPDSSWFM